MESFVACLQTLNRHLRSARFELNEQPVSRVQWMLLRHLHRKEESTIGQLAEHLDVRASTMSQMLDRMEKSGFVARGSQQQDARVKLVRLTAEGKAMITSWETAWIESLAEPFNYLSDDEKQNLVRLMKKLSDHLPRRGGKACPTSDTPVNIGWGLR